MLVIATSVGTAVAFFAAVINRLLKFGLLSRLAERVVFVLIPPLALIFLVLGTIFLGVATPFSRDLTLHRDFCPAHALHHRSHDFPDFFVFRFAILFQPRGAFWQFGQK